MQQLAKEAADKHRLINSLIKCHSTENLSLIFFSLILNDNQFVMKKLPSFPIGYECHRRNTNAKKSALITASDHGQFNQF